MKVKVLHGMVLVNMFQKKNETKICEDLGNLFLQKLSVDCYEYDEICLLFYQYNFKNSLKERTQNIWTEGNTTYYKITPKTNLEHTDLKVLIQFKNKAWTIFLGTLAEGHLRKGGKTYPEI